MDEEILEKISTCDEMYVDQEATQDDEETNRTGTNRPPTAGTDVSVCARRLRMRDACALGSPDDSSDASTTFYCFAFFRGQSSARILRQK